jgi:putative transposase
MSKDLSRFYGGNDLHFLTFSCYRRLPFFGNEVYCELFLKVLERVRRRYRLVVIGYVVMPEHVHLIMSEPQRNRIAPNRRSLGTLRR